LNHVAAVLHRYEGPFLDGDDGDWILEERERLHSLFLRTATMAVCRLGAVGLYHEAIALARRALRFDPYREELVRNLLTCWRSTSAGARRSSTIRIGASRSKPSLISHRSRPRAACWTRSAACTARRDFKHSTPD
jgi:hypothetical protein